jgi:5-methylcytosine-specific restriction protein A
MVTAALRYCTTPGCPSKVAKGRCPDCQRTQAAAKGVRYTKRWAAYSRQRLARHPWCVGYPAGYHGAQQVLAQCTDHIQSAVAHPDLFWDSSNHQSLCHRCNTVKAITQEGGFGR